MFSVISPAGAGLEPVVLWAARDASGRSYPPTLKENNRAMRVETHPLAAADAALLAHGLDGAGAALRMLVNEASQLERAQPVHAHPYERAEERAG